MLRVAIGKADNYEDSIIAAVEQYNEVEGSKSFHDRQTIMLPGIFITTIFFTVREVTQQEPKHEFIGSEGIDPNDPNWREKWEAMNSQGYDGSYQVEVSPSAELEVIRHTSEA